MSAYNQLFLLFLVLFLPLELLVAAARASLSNPRTLRALAQRENDPAARKLLAAMQQRNGPLAALKLTQLIARLGIAGCVLALLPFSIDSWANIAWTSGVLLLVSFLVFLLEETIEAAAESRYENWLLRLAPLTHFLRFLLTPFVGISILLHQNDDETIEQASRVTEDDLKSIVDASHEGGVLEQDEREMIYKIFRLRETLAREVMVPRIYITALEVNIKVGDAVQALLESGFSRAPVYEESVDHVIGLLYARDLLRATHGGNQIENLRDVLRPVYFVPEAKRVDVLLDEMQSRQVHMAIVVDEYGGVAGPVTL